MSEHVIRAKVLARKLAGVAYRRFPQLNRAIEAQPRIVEALWFLQWRSMQPGGLEAFAEELVAVMPERVGTPSMRRFGRRTYTHKECVQVLTELPEKELTLLHLRTAVEHALVGLSVDDGELGKYEKEYRRMLAEFVREKNQPVIYDLCRKRALEKLPRLFAAFCDEPSLGFDSPWYFQDLFPALFQHMDEHAARVSARLAKTAVAEKVFDALEYAWSERVMVRIDGPSRFGKSESVTVWAEMYPGRGRIVRVPSSNSLRDLQLAVAEAFDMDDGYGQRTAVMAEEIGYVLQFARVAIVFDEAAWLIPGNYTANTPPARLNWIRSAIVDRKIPCALIVTPQSYNGALNRFVKKTGYSIEQFLGREAMRVTLPSELPHAELLAVARIHFPEADDDLLGLVAAKALQSESYLKAVENISRRARFIARKRGAKKIALADVDRAIEEVMPAPRVPAPREAAAPVAAAPAKRSAAKTRQPSRSATAEPLRPDFERGGNTDLAAEAEASEQRASLLAAG